MREGREVCAAAFSECGVAMARRIAVAVGGSVWAPAKYSGEGVGTIAPSLAEWTAEHFCADALIFVSACGIAVRAIAPCVKSKLTDPAVIVVDDMGRHVISLMSGHIGGANELAEKIACITGGEAVVTTATDVRGAVAVDEWAVKNNCAIENPPAVKSVSSAVLADAAVGVAVTDEKQKAPWPVTLWLRPRDLVLGIGCKKEIAPEQLLNAIDDFLESSGVSPLSICAVASIDIKKDEPAIKAAAERFSVPLATYTADELNAVEGHFTASERVKGVTGTDNVCERAAARLSRGPLIRGKTIYPGITLALSRYGRDTDDGF